MRRRTFTKCLLAVLTAGSCVAMQPPAQPAGAQSVVEAAKQRSGERKAKHVYTEDDLPPRPESTPSTAQPGSEEEQTDRNAKSAPPDDRNVAQGEAKAEPQVHEAEKVVEAKKIQIETLTEEKTRLEQRLQQPGISADEYSTISESIRSIDKKVDGWKKELADAQKLIDSAKPKQPSETQSQ